MRAEHGNAGRQGIPRAAARERRPKVRPRRARVGRAVTIGRDRPELFDARTQVAYITVDKCWKSRDLGPLAPLEMARRLVNRTNTLRARSARRSEETQRRRANRTASPTNRRRNTVGTNPIDRPDSEPLSAEAWQQELAAQRARAEELLAAQKDTIGEIEKELAAKLDQLTSDLTEAGATSDLDRQRWRDKTVDLEQGLHEAQRIKTTLLAQQESWQQAQTHFDQQQQQRIARLDEQRELLEEREEELRQSRRKLATQQAQLEVALTEVTTKQDCFQTRLVQLEEERREIETLADQTRRQRQRIAQEFRQERTALHRRLAAAEQLTQATTAQPATETTIEPPSAPTPQDDTTAADWERKYGLAMEELRKLRSENKELQAQAAQPAAPSNAPIQPAVAGGGFDWEAEKRRLVSQLDAGHDATDSAARQDRLRIEDVIRRTDEIVAAKDQEIARLREELEQERKASQSMVGNADELEQLVDADELIQQERAHLEELQQQLRDKLRKAEVELSMERAKIARERVELEELAESIPTAAPQAPKSTEEGKPRGRWLSRLGLAGEEGEE